MHPYRHAEEKPDQPALVLFERDEVLTYGDLEKASNRVAHQFRRLGLARGDVVALLLKNGLTFPIAYWGAQRAGLMICPISTHLKTGEIAYILNDSAAKALLTSADVGETSLELFSNRRTLIP